jgi:hypothetical protein
MKIYDGKGSGRQAEVGEDFKLKVNSEASDSAFIANQSGLSFIYSTPILSVGAAAEYGVAYIANSENSASLIIDLEKIHFDGGTTSNTKPLFVKFYVNSSVPTTNATPKDPNGASTESSGKISTDFQVWDGVSTGFVQAVTGDVIKDGIFAIGENDHELPSKFILGPGKSMTYSVECEEACKISIEIFAHILEA